MRQVEERLALLDGVRRTLAAQMTDNPLHFTLPGPMPPTQVRSPPVPRQATRVAASQRQQGWAKGSEVRICPALRQSSLHSCGSPVCKSSKPEVCVQHWNAACDKFMLMAAQRAGWGAWDAVASALSKHASEALAKEVLAGYSLPTGAFPELPCGMGESAPEEVSRCQNMAAQHQAYQMQLPACRFRWKQQLFQMLPL